MKNTVQIPINDIVLEGNLIIPLDSPGLVVFSHGAGSSRFSPRNNYVAKVLQDAGIGTLLLDLLTEEEDQVYENRFDIDLLTDRLLTAINWTQKETSKEKNKIGLFGASTGAASALNAAAILGKQIAAVVSRGGRPDLSLKNLAKVVSPTLFIIGELDEVVIELNRQAFTKLAASEKMLEIIPGATHLFEEPGALEQVADLAKDWFKKYL